MHLFHGKFTDICNIPATMSPATTLPHPPRSTVDTATLCLYHLSSCVVAQQRGKHDKWWQPIICAGLVTGHTTKTQRAQSLSRFACICGDRMMRTKTPSQRACVAHKEKMNGAARACLCCDDDGMKPFYTSLWPRLEQSSARRSCTVFS